MALTLENQDLRDAAFRAQTQRARGLLARPNRSPRAWPALAAAGFFAASAVLFATVLVMAPLPSSAAKEALRTP
jgi:hypothetical protein